MDKLGKWHLWRDEVTQKAYGNWQSIATSICSNSAIDTLLKGKNISCPECGKRDKLFISDVNTLSAHCCSNKCSKHYHDGIALIADLDGISHTDVLKNVAANLGLDGNNSSSSRLRVIPKKPIPEPVREVKASAVKQREYLSSSIKPITDDCLVIKYLENRGLDFNRLPKEIKDSLFFHENLSYYKKLLDEKDNIIGEERGIYPAMVSKVLDGNMNLIGFHKTYLDNDGHKAKVSAPKQLSSALYRWMYSENGSVVVLSHSVNGRYGIAEGIETALAVCSMNRPCWSVINANGIKTFPIPSDCKTLDLYGDLDKSGTGQQVIIEKYYEVKESNPEIQVNLYLPPEEIWDLTKNPKGIDFLDAYLKNPKLLPMVKG